MPQPTDKGELMTSKAKAVLQLQMKAVLNPHWGGLTLTANEAGPAIIDREKLQGCASQGILKHAIPDGEHIVVEFKGATKRTKAAAVLVATVQVTNNRHVVRPGEKIVIPVMSGRRPIGIGGIRFVATVSPIG